MSFNQAHNVQNNKDRTTLYRSKSESNESESNESGSNEKTIVFTGLKRSNSYPPMGKLKSERDALVDFVTQNLYNEFCRGQWDNGFCFISIKHIRRILNDEEIFQIDEDSDFENSELTEIKIQDYRNTMIVPNEDPKPKFIWSLWNEHPISVSCLHSYYMSCQSILNFKHNL